MASVADDYRKETATVARSFAGVLFLFGCLFCRPQLVLRFLTPIGHLRFRAKGTRSALMFVYVLSIRVRLISWSSRPIAGRFSDTERYRRPGRRNAWVV